MSTACPDCRCELDAGIKVCPHCGAKVGGPSKAIAAIALIGVIAACSIGIGQDQGRSSAGTDAGTVLLQSFGPAVVDRDTPAVPAKAFSRPQSPLKAEVIKQIELADTHWQRNAAGAEMMLNADIANQSWFDVKDVEVTCHQYSGQGKRIAVNRRTVEGVIVKSGGQCALVSFNMGPIDPQTAGTECEVSNLVLVGMWPGWIAENEPRAPETIKEMQRRLASRGHYDGRIDGVIGPKTKAAVEKFEAQQEALLPTPVNAGLNGRLALD